MWGTGHIPTTLGVVSRITVDDVIRRPEWAIGHNITFSNIIIVRGNQKPYYIPPISKMSVASAAKLTTARTINGTSFDGSANITTANWGTARNISIADNFSTHTSSAVSVDGSANVTLNLPTTITATLDGNAASATKLATPRTIWGQSFNGSANISGRMYDVAGIGNWMNFNNSYGSIGVGGAAPTDYYVLKFHRNVNRPCMIFNDTRSTAGFQKIEF